MKNRFGNEKPFYPPQQWTKTNCLYCSKDLGVSKIAHSASYFNSIHESCAEQFGLKRTQYLLKTNNSI